MRMSTRSLVSPGMASRICKALTKVGLQAAKHSPTHADLINLQASLLSAGGTKRTATVEKQEMGMDRLDLELLMTALVPSNCRSNLPLEDGRWRDGGDRKQHTHHSTCVCVCVRVCTYLGERKFKSFTVNDARELPPTSVSGSGTPWPA